MKAIIELEEIKKEGGISFYKASLANDSQESIGPTPGEAIKGLLDKYPNLNLTVKKSIKAEEFKEMKIALDGNALCITKKDFVNLQESPAFFIELPAELIEQWKKFNGASQ